MDGVVANFQHLALDAFGVKHIPEMWEVYSVGDKLGFNNQDFWNNLIECRYKKESIIKKFINKIITFFKPNVNYKRDNIKIFEACECYSWTNELIDLCLKYADRVCFLSCVGYSYPNGFTEKINWLIKHKLNKKNVGIILMKNREKALLVSDNGPVCLIDDYQDNIDEFTKAGGYGILFPALYNKNIKIHLQNPVAYVENQIKQQLNNIYK